ncbi:MAG: NAD(P)/FAD-dependent oxidoreductase [Pseudomonadota bacterium]|nr:NAD(P)/FAD-dependent oxidoreductase [Pseudomonadota bacterium]
MKSSDVIVIGAGHNGLAAATSLSMRGVKVLLLEAAESAGGMMRNHELAPGFRVSRAAHLVHRLTPATVERLALRQHGLEYAATAVPTVCLSSGNEPVVLRGRWGETVEGVSGDEAGAWGGLRERLLFQAGLLGRFDGEIPVQPGAAGHGQKLALARAGLALRMAGTGEFRQFLRMALMCAADIGEEVLHDDRLKGLLAFDATLGIGLGPRSPTSVLGLYHRLSGVTEGGHAALVSVKGGTGALAAAFANAARAAGVELRASCPVASIEVGTAGVAGVRLANGETVSAPKVVSAASPVTTFRDLVGPRHLDTGFMREVRHLRHGGNVAKLNLALSAPPRFEGTEAGLAGARFVYAPSIDHVEASYNPTKYGELPEDPPFELVVESASDPTMAPAGSASVSVIISNVPHDLKQGWDTGRDKLMKRVLARLEAHAPGIAQTIVASELLAPPDLGATFGVPGGHWHHVEYQGDRLYALRPVFGAAHYRSPVDGLYLCGAGTHPGGGISGQSGLNAADQVLRDLEQ